MKIKTTELIGPDLDWAVAKAQDIAVRLGENNAWHVALSDGPKWTTLRLSNFRPSTDWEQGGPIIDREIIETHFIGDGFWAATKWGINPYYKGETLLIAAMRCIVASKLGGKVEVPEELR